MSNPLATYLEGHLAGAIHAIEVVGAIRDQHSDQPLGRFAANLLVEIKDDRDVLPPPSNPVLRVWRNLALFSFTLSPRAIAPQIKNIIQD